jgi:hypothetical protein
VATFDFMFNMQPVGKNTTSKRRHHDAVLVARVGPGG